MHNLDGAGSSLRFTLNGIMRFIDQAMQGKQGRNQSQAIELIYPGRARRT
jgi:hypothetical protein